MHACGSQASEQEVMTDGALIWSFAVNIGQYEVNTTIMKIKRSRALEIDPQTSGLLGTVLTFTPPGQLRNLTIELL